MNIQELIKKYEEKYETVFGFPVIQLNQILEDLRQLDEPQKVTIPQFVADWLEQSDWREETLGKQSVFDVLDNLKNGCYENVKRWIDENGDLFARAWLDGYEVEKEKQYEVLLCNGQSLKTVYRQGGDRLDFEKVYGDLERFTRKQLEDAGLGWAFDCQGIEIREVAE